ncbi:MAG: formylglycine-generating enzyme family protein [Arachidicoccus sp.]|nr:formylglycine-generating enzyme family protein [Arachidicoccus sp.]
MKFFNSTTIYLLPFSLIILFSCKSKIKNSTAIQPAVPIDCTVCKAPSRAAQIRASLLNDTNSQTGLDTGKMILLNGGTFEMGSKNFPDAQPVHKVTVSPYYIDEHEVTNDQFAKFVKATNYVTVAERPLNPKDYPGVPKDKLAAGSGVFTPPNHPVDLNNPMQWWTYIPHANWRHPTGPDSDIKERGNYPIVQVCYEDCLAYAKWAGKRLPTEAEWEFAAKGGHDYPTYYWGTEKIPNGKYMANNFQGIFPYNNTKKDGYEGVAPIEQFPKNAYGIYDLEGNVWEWCNDYYRPDYYSKSPEQNPLGPNDSYDPEEPGAVKRVQRGGSFLCSDDYCLRYKAGSRGKGEQTSASNNLGFRCVRSR